VVMKSPIFWDITPCSPLKVNRRFGGIYRLNFHDRNISQARNQGESNWQAKPPYFIQDRLWCHKHKSEYLTEISSVEENKLRLSVLFPSFITINVTVRNVFGYGYPNHCSFSQEDTSYRVVKIFKSVITNLHPSF
jgi:hypothetical protein